MAANMSCMWIQSRDKKATKDIRAAPTFHAKLSVAPTATRDERTAASLANTKAHVHAACAVPPTKKRVKRNSQKEPVAAAAAAVAKLAATCTVAAANKTRRRPSRSDRKPEAQLKSTT